MIGQLLHITNLNIRTSSLVVPMYCAYEYWSTAIMMSF
jgi:hypothetical protein